MLPHPWNRRFSLQLHCRVCDPFISQSVGAGGGGRAWLLRGVDIEGVCGTRVRRGSVCFVLSDSLKLYLVQVKAGADVREGGAGECVWCVWEGRGEGGSNTSVQDAAQLSALS